MPRDSALIAKSKYLFFVKGHGLLEFGAIIGKTLADLSDRFLPKRHTYINRVG